MSVNSSCDEEQTLCNALSHLESAIDLLDQAQASAHIAAYVDLARHELMDAIHAYRINRHGSYETT